MTDVPTSWVVGDVQGFLNPLQRVLSSVGLIDWSGAWTGRRASLTVLGDLVDRGPDGIGVIEFLIRLQSEALPAGGQVQVIVGNHDILLLAAKRFSSLIPNWQLSGGVSSDLERLRDVHIRWLQDLPALLVEHDVLMLHADAMFYLEYGATLDEVNARFAHILHSNDLDAWNRLLDNFAEHRAFLGPDGCSNLERMLAAFGGNRLIHGHTPVPRVTRQPPESVTGPYIYCDGRCVNVDPGFYLGGPGFCYAL